MSWFGWFTESDSGDQVNMKVEKTERGDSNVHYMRATGSDRSDHSHVVYSKHADGSRSAHAAPTKSKR